MTNLRKATDKIEGYGKMVQYFTVPCTRKTPYPTYRVQAIMGHWRDVGIGKTYEDAKEDAAEKVLDKLDDAKTSVANNVENLLIKNARLQKQIQALEFCKKEFAVEKIDFIWNKINNTPNIGGFDAHDLYQAAEEVLAKIGFTLKLREVSGIQGKIAVLFIESRDFPTRAVVEVGTEEADIKMKALANILFMERWRLFAQIERQMESERKSRAARFSAVPENTSARRNGQHRRRNQRH